MANVPDARRMMARSFLCAREGCCVGDRSATAPKSAYVEDDVIPGEDPETGRNLLAQSAIGLGGGVGLGANSFQNTVHRKPSPVRPVTTSESMV